MNSVQLPTLFARLLIATAFILAYIGTASAALIVEEQFLIGPNNYTANATISGTSPDGTTGYNPTDAWGTQAASSAVDARVRSSGLSYTDGHGGTLSVAGGHLDTFRNGQSTFAKDFKRVTTDISTRSAVGDEVWFSLLVNTDGADFTTGNNSRSLFCWDHDTGGAERKFGIEFVDGSTNLHVRAGGTSVDTGLTLPPGTNLVVVRLADRDFLR